MPGFIKSLFGASEKDTVPVNRFEDITAEGAVVLRDRRGTRKAEIPDVSLKGETLSDDPLAIYKPTGAKHVDAAKAMGNFTGWTFAAVNAIASEIELRIVGKVSPLKSPNESTSTRLSRATPNEVRVIKPRRSNPTRTATTYGATEFTPLPF